MSKLSRRRGIISQLDTLRDGLIREYLFSNNQNDTSDSGENLSIFTGTYVTDRDSNPNSSANFTGAFLDRGVWPTPVNETEWTCAMWINPVVPIPLVSPFFNIMCLIGGNSDTNFLAVRNQSLNIYTTIAVSFDFENNPGWYFVLFEYSGGQVRASVNNSTIGSWVSVTNPFQGVNSNIIANRSSSTNHYYAGDIDDIRIWNRLLTDVEKVKLYNL